MSMTAAEKMTLLQMQDCVPEEHPLSGTEDDDDDRDDEHAGENEASVRSVDDATEAPEEFEIDDEDAQNERLPAVDGDEPADSDR
jgi:hypothetical protein